MISHYDNLTLFSYHSSKYTLKQYIPIYIMASLTTWWTKGYKDYAIYFVKFTFLPCLLYYNLHLLRSTAFQLPREINNF